MTLHLGWALGAFTTSVLVNSTGLLHLRFMTDSLGIGVALAGLLLAISKIYDGLTDPLMGLISDRTRSRWGRRRPWLLLGGVLCGLAMVAMFNVPRFDDQTSVTTYTMIALLFYSTAYTVFRIPYLALGADLSRSFDGRSRLMTFNVWGASVGSLFATTAAPFLLAAAGADRDAHGAMALILGALILISGVACFGLTTEPIDTTQAPAPRFSWRERLAALVQNRPFMMLIAAKIFLFIGVALHITSLAFLVRHVLGLDDFSLGTIFLMRTLATIASQPLWLRVAKRVGRRNALLAAIGFDIVLFAGWWFMPAAHAKPWLLGLGLLQGLASGGVFFNIQCMLADTMEHDSNRFGMRREGLFAGIFVMVEKFTSAIAVVVFGAVSGAMGYVASADVGVMQPDSAILAIRLLVAAFPAAFMALAMCALWGYRIPEQER